MLTLQEATWCYKRPADVGKQNTKGHSISLLRGKYYSLTFVAKVIIIFNFDV
jgi:hypothetical protein